MQEAPEAQWRKVQWHFTWIARSAFLVATILLAAFVWLLYDSFLK